MKDFPDDEATEAFLTLMLQHRHRLCAFIAKQLVSSSDVEDVFQKTSLILWKKMNDYDPQGSFFHWACGIAFNEVRNFLRVQRRNRMHFDTELVTLLADEAKAEGDLSEARREALQICISKLTPKQRQLIERCYNDHQTISEVADELGQKRDALYKQLARLRDRLRNCIRLQLAQDGVY